MTTATKMIIITSNEDIIRQFSSQKIKDTHIIDFDSDKQTSPIGNDNNNIINLAFLAELSKHNFTNDQVYKRALDSSDHNQSKPVKVSKKSIDMICDICGDQAIGFHYDVLTCSSCKVFFRRNAHQNLENMRCLIGQGQCSVAHTMRRKCTKCRLERCFTAGMKKDFFLSEEEKQRRRKRLEEKRKASFTGVPTSQSNLLSSLELIPQAFDTLTDMNNNDNDITVVHENTNSNQIDDALFEMLPVEDWITIQSVRSSFVSIFENDNEQCACVDVSDRTLAFISWSQFIQQVALRFIDFFRQIDEFEDLHLDDRLNLIKNNVLLVFPISKCFHYNPIDDCCSFGENEAAVRQRQFYILCGDSNGMRDEFVNLVLSLVEITKQDPTTLSLLSVILFFSRGLLINEDEPLLKDSLAVNRAQSYYTKLLWNYLVNQWGENQAHLYFTQLLTIIFRIQSMAKGFRDFFRIKYITSDIVDKMAPVMQSVLYIS